MRNFILYILNDKAHNKLIYGFAHHETTWTS